MIRIILLATFGVGLVMVLTGVALIDGVLYADAPVHIKLHAIAFAVFGFAATFAVLFYLFIHFLLTREWKLLGLAIVSLVLLMFGSLLVIATSQVYVNFSTTPLFRAALEDFSGGR